MKTKGISNHAHGSEPHAGCILFSMNQAQVCTMIIPDPVVSRRVYSPSWAWQLCGKNVALNVSEQTDVSVAGNVNPFQKLNAG